MKQFFKKSLIFVFSLSLISSSCSIRKNNVEEIKELPKKEIINVTVIPKEKEVSARGKVLCFESKIIKLKTAYHNKISMKKSFFSSESNFKHLSFFNNSYILYPSEENRPR